MNLRTIINFVLWIVALIVLILAVHFALDLSSVNVDNQVQTKVDIYHHFTVYTTRIDGALFVVEIDVDETLPYACDGWIEDEENGQNCVIVSPDGLREIVNAFNLPINGIIGE